MCKTQIKIDQQVNHPLGDYKISIKLANGTTFSVYTDDYGLKEDVQHPKYVEIENQ